MRCNSCGAEIADEGKYCPKCGIAVEPVTGDTKPPLDLGATRIFQEKELGKTVVFTPRDACKPIFGWLVVIEGQDPWHESKIHDEEGQLFLGTGDECQLKLQDEKLSKLHASIRLKDGKLTIADLDTSTGTMLNDKPITKSDLEDGDIVKFGETTLKFRRL